MATVCVGCDKESKDNGEEPSGEIPAKPKLGYIDFANWWEIYLKDAETAMPKIKGTMISDDTTRWGRELVYEYDSDCGLVTTYYTFNKNGLLETIFANLMGDRQQHFVTDLLMRHTKTIAYDLNSFIYAKENGKSYDFTFNFRRAGELPSEKTSEYLLSDEMHSALWELVNRYAAQYASNDFHYEGDEYYFLSEQWMITDDVDHPDSTTPYVTFELMLGGSPISVSVKRHYI